MDYINYFGTSLTSAGHYFWKIYEDGDMENLGLRGQHDWKFSPEFLNQNGNDGDVNYIKFNHITIIAINGSCYDRRNGCKSVFWTEENISFDELKEAILTFPKSKEIISKSLFDVKW